MRLSDEYGWAELAMRVARRALRRQRDDSLDRGFVSETSEDVGSKLYDGAERNYQRVYIKKTPDMPGFFSYVYIISLRDYSFETSHHQ